MGLTENEPSPACGRCLHWLIVEFQTYHGHRHPKRQFVECGAEVTYAINPVSTKEIDIMEAAASTTATTRP